ncbi:hypothetical protein VISI1226_04839 [Vibrio sinaloensis DSM 21326]|uniref:Uncharacterized protein n=1 Tax=Vibrio sinaloensis DSM 21326 TaxID=945550 RepID=E8M1C2_PHOS4|nr:hypothetical protein VISI1226_04839 [Vibrio sinaloensis DSM 21326]
MEIDEETKRQGNSARVSRFQQTEGEYSEENKRAKQTVAFLTLKSG